MSIIDELTRIDQYQEIPDMNELCQDDFTMLAKIVRDCHRAGFVTDAGEVRAVLGTLPITKDGAIACQDSVVWHPDSGACYPVPDGLNVAAKVYGGTTLVPVSDCYSTKAAAEAGRNSDGR